MPQFIITAKMPISGLPNGMRIERNQSFTVNVPQNSTTPFATPQARFQCMQQLGFQGFDFSRNQNYLTGGYFDYKKL